MIYCVVPRPLADELYPKLVEHYKDEQNVTVIVDRRQFDRRARYGHAGSPPDEEQRRVYERVRLGILGSGHRSDRPALEAAQGGHCLHVERTHGGVLDLVD
ncbi:MAG TPA: hypothetical protein VN892_16965, partial [Solirubrobacteraceae bacterium]|nr:hypothetical protein [Solirubrobacteraceae bacterium]